METETTQASTDDDALNINASNQCLTFKLANEEYGIDILKVQEIRSWESATSIPNTPEFVVGVVNLRGTVVPIIDLRTRFCLDKLKYGASTVVVVVKVEHQGNERTVGLVVDAVSEVYNISPEMICETPKIGSAINTEFVRGLATIDEKMIILLNIDLMVSPEQLNIQKNIA